jgi:hypothetical protein
MTNDELLDRLRELGESDDPEDAHYEADRALLAFIADDAVTKAFEAIDKWYA